ncbi:MAG: hypothetical protein JWM89_1365 [Acidimicrobiales bacterium]|nr:hypothetical protein [Acidimicrobiales bacterium]
MRGWVWLAPPVLVGILPLLVVLVAAVENVHRVGVSRGDYAFIELSTRSALHGRALLGPYSRYRWNHPGPALFYWFAPFYRLSGEAPESLGVGAAVCNTLAVAVAIVVSGVASGKRAAWLIGAGSVALVWVWGYSWIDRIWNPFIILMVIVATGFVLAAVLSGCRWLTPLLVAFATFTVQSHVGTAPIIALFACAAVVGIARSAWKDRRAWLAPLAASLGVAVLGWSLPVYEQFTGHPGNLGELIQFLRASHGRHGVGEVLDKVAVQFTLSKMGLLSNVVSAKRELPGATAPRMVVLVLLLGCVGAGIYLNRRAGRRFEQHLCEVALLAALGVFVACLRVVGKLEGYLTMPATAVGALLWSAAALTLAGEVSDRLSDRHAPRLAVALVAIAVVGTLWFSNDVRQGHPERSLQVRQYPDPAALAISNDLRDALPRRSGDVLLEPSGPTMATAGMLANQIELGGTRVHVDRRLDYFFGRERRSDGCEAVVVRVGATGEAPRRDAGRVVGVFASQVVQVRQVVPPSRCD